MNSAAQDPKQLWGLKFGATIGTSSARRKAIIKALRPDLQIEELRGNVPTRIDKLRQGNYDAILLANAGVSRLQLNLSDLQTKVLDPKSFVPAPAQGVLGLQTRSTDIATQEVLSALHHPEVASLIDLERGVLKAMDGGCQLPLGVYVADDAVYVAHSKSAQVAAQFYRFESGSQVQQIVAHLNAQP